MLDRFVWVYLPPLGVDLSELLCWVLFRVYAFGLGFRVLGLGCRVPGSGSRLLWPKPRRNDVSLELKTQRALWWHSWWLNELKLQP